MGSLRKIVFYKLSKIICFQMVEYQMLKFASICLMGFAWVTDRAS